MYVQDDLDPFLKSDAVTKVNGSIRLMPASEAWEVALVGNNITDVDDDKVWGNDMPLVNGASEIMLAPGASFSLTGLVRF